MKMAISASGPSLDAEVDPRFGRCQYFIIIDPDTMLFEAVENSSVMAAGGAGIATAQMVANKGAQVVLTGNCGPNAFQTLSAARIRVVTGVSGRIEDAVHAYRAGRFHEATQPSVAAHFGMGSGVGEGMVASRQPPSLEQELEALKTQTQTLAQQVSDIQRRLTEMESKKR